MLDKKKKVVFNNFRMGGFAAAILYSVVIWLSDWLHINLRIYSLSFIIILLVLFVIFRTEKD